MTTERNGTTAIDPALEAARQWRQQAVAAATARKEAVQKELDAGRADVERIEGETWALVAAARGGVPEAKSPPPAKKEPPKEKAPEAQVKSEAAVPHAIASHPYRPRNLAEAIEDHVVGQPTADEAAVLLEYEAAAERGLGELIVTPDAPPKGGGVENGAATAKSAARPKPPTAPPTRKRGGAPKPA